jgi:hypothetical protein
LVHSGVRLFPLSKLQCFILFWHFHESSIPVCKASNGDV